MKVIITCYVDDDFKYNLSKGHEIGDAVDELFEGRCSEYTVELKSEYEVPEDQIIAIQRLPRSADRITGLPQKGIDKNEKCNCNK